MNLIIANVVIYGLFGLCVWVITRHHDRKMQAIWDKWDAKYAEIMEKRNDTL